MKAMRGLIMERVPFLRRRLDAAFYVFLQQVARRHHIARRGSYLRQVGVLRSVALLNRRPRVVLRLTLGLRAWQDEGGAEQRGTACHQAALPHLVGTRV